MPQWTNTLWYRPLKRVKNTLKTSTMLAGRNLRPNDFIHCLEALFCWALRGRRVWSAAMRQVRLGKTWCRTSGHSTFPVLGKPEHHRVWSGQHTRQKINNSSCHHVWQRGRSSLKLLNYCGQLVHTCWLDNFHGANTMTKKIHEFCSWTGPLVR